MLEQAGQDSGKIEQPNAGAEFYGNLSEQTGPGPEARPAEVPVFRPDQEVAVLRKSGQMDYGWRVHSTREDGKIQVIGEDPHKGGAVKKAIYPEELASWQPRFESGKAVKIEGIPGWHVAHQLPNGDVIVEQSIENSQQSLLRRVNAVELARMQFVDPEETRPVKKPQSPNIKDRIRRLK